MNCSYTVGNLHYQENMNHRGICSTTDKMNTAAVSPLIFFKKRGNHAKLEEI